MIRSYLKTSVVGVVVAESLRGELEGRDEANERLSAELDGCKEDVDRMMDVLKTKEQEHAGETAELINRNSELAEMLDETIEKMDTAQKELEEQAARLSDTDVRTTPPALSFLGRIAQGRF